MAKKLSPEELAQRREQVAFARKIRTIFTNAGFVSLPSNGVHQKFGTKTGELDHIFIFENVVVICEDTITSKPKEHLINKSVLFGEIDKNRDDFINWIRAQFDEQLKMATQYDTSRYVFRYLYFSKRELVLTEDDINLIAPTIAVNTATLGYFAKIARNIRRSSRTDIFRFLGIGTSDIGYPNSGSSSSKIPTTIIYPSDNTGLGNGARIVSFMMSADMLLRNSYVLRKDNWEESIQLYQRLIERERIQSIRKYLASRKVTFFNNIIVSLPPDLEFRDKSGKPIGIEDIGTFGAHQMLIPDEMNSICIIDGQHRIFAHYEGTDVLEPGIAELRKKLHLLVTGVVFPESMTSLERRRFESELFLDINSNARPVPPDVLLFIETLKDPFSPLGVARKVIERLNVISPFANRFQLSLLDEGKIKIASVIKFALRYLVEITDDPARPTLFAHWAGPQDRAALLVDAKAQSDTTRLDAYVKFAADTLAAYFGALRSERKVDWDDETSRILSTTSINGFLIAMRDTLESHGVGDLDSYRKRMAKLTTDFSREGFPFASSQYRKFSVVVAQEIF